MKVALDRPNGPKPFRDNGSGEAQFFDRTDVSLLPAPNFDATPGRLSAGYEERMHVAPSYPGLGSWKRLMIGMRSMIRSRSRGCGGGGTYTGAGGTYTGAGGTYAGAGGT
jgi:hypothetical protein